MQLPNGAGSWKQLGFTNIGAQHCSEPVWFNACFKGDPLERFECSSPVAPAHGTSRGFYKHWRPALLRASVVFKCAPQVAPRRTWRGSGCSSPWALAYGTNRVVQKFVPSTAPSQCGLKCASKWNPWRGSSATPHQRRLMETAGFYKHWSPALLRASVV